MPFAIHDDVRLYWRIEGAAAKPCLFLLNSIGTDMSLWDRMIPHLAGAFRVLRMDTRGHGASDAPPGDYNLDQLAADALAVMDAAGVSNATVCGLSLGGMIAMTMALTAPDRVERLVLACTSAAMDVQGWRTRIGTIRASGMVAIGDTAMQRFFSDRFRRDQPDVVATVRANLIGMSVDGYAGCGAAIRDMALLDRLPGITMPVLIVVGTLDSSTPLEGHGDRMMTAMSHAELATLDAAHLACVEQPDAFAAAVAAFVTPADPAVGEARDLLFEVGLKNRRAVLGDAWVDRSLENRTPFNADFQAMITRIAWHEIWGRPGLDHRTRRLLVVAITASLGRWEEFRLHVRAGLARGGFTVEELKETLMQTAIYAGVPAANTAFAEAAAVMRESAKETV